MSIISESENHYERILRERDELAALLAAEKATRNSIIEKGVKTERELVEAREEIDDIRKMLSESGEAIGNGVHDFSIIEMVENIIQSKNYFIKKSDSAEWERDEVREENDILRLDAQREAEQHDRMVGELEKVYKERDEVREQYENLKLQHGLWKDGNILCVLEGAK